MDARITIKTFSDGELTDFEAPAVYETAKGGVRVRYRDGEDRVTLEAGEGELSLLREGENGQSAVFRPGEASCFLLTFMGKTGRLPLFTEHYNIIFADKTLLISLSYRLGEGDAFRTFGLEISVQSISEEK